MNPVIIFGIFLLSQSVVEGKFKSLHCTIHEKNYGDFPICKIKAINRYRNSINVLYRQIRPVATGVSVRMEIFKRANGWHPFLYNVSVNLCDLLKHNRSYLMRLAYEYVKPFLTITDACPWKLNGTVKCEKFELDLDLLHARFPFDSGEYAAQFTFYLKNIPRVSVNGSAEYINYREN